MNESKHTPGPWRVEWPFEGGALITAEDGHGEIAQVKTRYSKTNNIEEAHANARLIAAAPDLLALVRSYATTYPLDEYYDKATAAIAKATGDK
jgi:hypothetical protein